MALVVFFVVFLPTFNDEMEKGERRRSITPQCKEAVTTELHRLGSPNESISSFHRRLDQEIDRRCAGIY